MDSDEQDLLERRQQYAMLSDFLYHKLLHRLTKSYNFSMKFNDKITHDMNLVSTLATY
jgi:hypothetical protein